MRIPDGDWEEFEDVDLQKLFTALYQQRNLSTGPQMLARCAKDLKAEGVDIKRGE